MPDIKFTFNIFAVQRDSVPGQGMPLFTIDASTVPSPATFYAGVTSWIVGDTDDTMVYPANTVLTSGQVLNSGSGTYYNIYPNGGVYYYSDPNDITNSTESVLYIDQVEVSPGIYQIRGDPDNQSNWHVVSQLNGNSAIVGNAVNYLDTSPLSGSNNSPPATYFLAIAQVAPPTITITLYAHPFNAQNGGADGSPPRLAQFTGTTYTVPTATGVYGGVNKWQVLNSDDIGLVLEIVTSGSTFNSNGTYFSLVPLGGVFYYNNENDVFNNRENPIYIDQSTSDPAGDVFEVLATSENQTSWVVTGGSSGLAGREVAVGSDLLTGASTNFSYSLAKVIPPTPPLTPSVTFTFYAREEDGINGGPNGNGPRLAQFTSTTYTIPTAAGVYGGVTRWIVSGTDDNTISTSGTGSLLAFGTTFYGNGTYYNLAPFGAVFYYNTANDVTNSPGTPIYIDQSTISGNDGLYQVLATSENQTSWVVYNSDAGDLIGETILVGSNSLTGASNLGNYYLVKVQAPPPNSVRFTFYASATDAQNGGPNGNGLALNQYDDTNYIVRSSFGGFETVTTWIVRASDNTNLIGTIVTAGLALPDTNGTYFNLSPNGGVFYYETQSDLINTPGGPRIISQTKIDGDIYPITVRFDYLQTSWTVSRQINGNPLLVNQRVLLTDKVLTGASTGSSYYLIAETTPPPTSVKITLYAKATDAQNGGPNGNGPRLAQFTGTILTGQIFTLIAPTGVYGGVTYWTVQSSDSNLTRGVIVTAETIRLENTGTYFNLSPYGGVFYYNTASDITSNPNTPIYIDQSTIDPAGDVYKVVATSANQTSWVINSQLNGNSTVVGETVAVDATRLGGVSNSPSSFYYLVKVQAPRPPCFLEGSTILTDNGYVTIESIRPGMLVQTNLDGLKKVEVVGYSSIYNPSSTDRLKNRLYVCKKDNYPELTEDLVLTGDHSILVDDITDEERELMIESLGRIFVTSNKYRLTAQADARALPYPIEGTFNVWHLALENDLDNTNYGIYANGGLLVESAPIKALKTKENVTLV